MLILGERGLGGGGEEEMYSFCHISIRPLRLLGTV